MSSRPNGIGSFARWQKPRTRARGRGVLPAWMRGRGGVENVRFKGGATTTLKVAPALSAWQMRQTRPEVLVAIDELLGQNTDAEIANALNERGFETGTGKGF